MGVIISVGPHFWWVGIIAGGRINRQSLSPGGRNYRRAFLCQVASLHVFIKPKNDRCRPKKDRCRRNVHLYDLLDVLDLVHELHLCHPPDVLELPDRPDHRQQKQKQQEQKQQHSLQQQRGARAKRAPPLLFPSPLLFLLFLFLLCVIRAIR